MDNRLLQRTKEKLKNELTQEEQDALRRCNDTVRTHTRVGSILGGGLSIYGMYRRKLWPLQKYWGRALFFGFGGIVVGMQLGLVTASARCVKIVQALPDPDHVMKALREVQIELQDARRRPMGEAREWKQMSENDDDQRTGSSEEDRMADRLKQSNDKVAYDYNGPPFGTRPPTQAPPEGSGGSGDAWSKIRGESLGRPETAWDRLRKGSSSSPAGTTASRDEDQSPFYSERRNNERQESGAFEPADNAVDDRDQRQREFDEMLERERAGTTSQDRYAR